MTEFKIGDRVKITEHPVFSEYIDQTGTVIFVSLSGKSFDMRLDTGLVVVVMEDEIEHYQDPRDAALDAMSEVFKTADSDDEIIRQIHFILLSVGR